MSKKLRVATWNVDRSGIRGKHRIQPQLKILESLEADILTLTETHVAIKPEGYEFTVAAEPDPSYHQVGESCATIWSRYPATFVPTEPSNRFYTVCASIQGPEGIGNILVYGTIIPYGGDGVLEGLTKPWERHRSAVKSQTAEWNTLRQKYPDHLIIVAGDFNENLDGKRWYGVPDAKEAIVTGLEAARMHCPTAMKDIPVMTGTLPLSRCTVNHICISKANAEIVNVQAWEGVVDGNTLSDHNGVLVDAQINLR